MSSLYIAFDSSFSDLIIYVLFWIPLFLLLLLQCGQLPGSFVYLLNLNWRILSVHDSHAFKLCGIWGINCFFPNVHSHLYKSSILCLICEDDLRKLMNNDDFCKECYSVWHTLGTEDDSEPSCRAENIAKWDSIQQPLQHTRACAHTDWQCL